VCIKYYYLRQEGILEELNKGKNEKKQTYYNWKINLALRNLSENLRPIEQVIVEAIEGILRAEKPDFCSLWYVISQMKKNALPAIVCRYNPCA